MKKHKPAKSEDIPLILSATYQRLDSYSKGVKNLFQAVSNLKLFHMIASLIAVYSPCAPGQRKEHKASVDASWYDEAHSEQVILQSQRGSDLLEGFCSVCNQ